MEIFVLEHAIGLTSGVKTRYERFAVFALFHANLKRWLSLNIEALIPKRESYQLIPLATRCTIVGTVQRKLAGVETWLKRKVLVKCCGVGLKETTAEN